MEANNRNPEIMLILTYQEYSAPTPLFLDECRDMAIKPPEPRRQKYGMATRLSLNQAIRRVAAYASARELDNPLFSVEYSLLAVSVVDELSDDEVRLGGMILVDRLEIDPGRM